LPSRPKSLYLDIEASRIKQDGVSMPTPRSRIWFHEFRRSGPRFAESQALHEQVLNLWAEGKTKAEIAALLDIDPQTVRKITWRARQAGDERAFARTKPILATTFTSRSVLELYREQYIVRGLAQAFEVPHAQMEELLRAIVRGHRSELAQEASGGERQAHGNEPEDARPRAAA
jgi:hypothetical protein